MNRFGTTIQALLAVGTIAALSPAGQPPAAPASAPFGAPTNGIPSDSNLAVQLESCRAGLSDAQGRPEDRKRWAQLLFTLEAPQAEELVRFFLKSGPPGAQLALCETITERGRVDASVLRSEWEDLLLDLFRSPEAGLRAAAGAALSIRNSDDLAVKLGNLAASDAESAATRLAAVAALTLHVDRRSHVRELIRLVDVSDAEVRGRVFAALEPTSRQFLGPDAASWKEWWQRKERLSSEEWLVDRIALYGDRLTAVQQELSLAREEYKRQAEALRTVAVDFQKEIHRLTAPEERNARLVQWLAHPLGDVRLTALSIIQTRMADDGRPPDGPLRDAILPLLKDPVMTVRRQAVLIVQNLSDPRVAEVLLERLPQESDVATRATMLKALGRVAGAEAVPALIRELEDRGADPACVREAAMALGDIAVRVEDAAVRDRMAVAMLACYRGLAGDALSLRAALLGAMAGVGHASFRGDVEEALNSTQPELLRSAIRGARALRLSGSMPRLRALTLDPDPMVRSASLDALGLLGGEDADLESILARLNPATEAHEEVREAAWRAFRELTKRRPAPVQFQVVQRLPDATDLPLRYLEQLIDDLEKQEEHESVLDAAYERLTALLSARARYVEAAVYGKKLYDLRMKRANGGAADAGLLWLAALLRGEREADAAAAIGHLALAGEDRVPSERILETVRQCLESPPLANDASAARQLHEALSENTPERPPTFWAELVQYLENRGRGGDARGPESRTPAG